MIYQKSTNRNLTRTSFADAKFATQNFRFVTSFAPNAAHRTASSFENFGDLESMKPVAPKKQKPRKTEYESQPTLNRLQREQNGESFVDSPYFENLLAIRRDAPEIFALFSDGLRKTLEYYETAKRAGNRLVDLPLPVRKKNAKTSTRKVKSEIDKPLETLKTDETHNEKTTTNRFRDAGTEATPGTRRNARTARNARTFTEAAQREPQSKKNKRRSSTIC